MSAENGRTGWKPELRDAARYALCEGAVHLVGFELRVLAAVVALTATWSKLTDEVVLARVAVMVGCWPDAGTEAQEREAARRVGKALKKIAAIGLIVYEPGSGRRPSLIGLRRPPKGWVDPTTSKLVRRDHGTGGESRALSWSVRTPQGGPQAPPDHGPHGEPLGSAAEEQPASPEVAAAHVEQARASLRSVAP